MLTIYFLESQYQYPRGWKTVFQELVNYLKESHGAKIIQQKGGLLRIEKFDYLMGDCEIMIHDEKEDILKIISWAEFSTRSVQLLNKRANNKDILIKTQHWGLFEAEKNAVPFKVKGSTFYPFTDTDHEIFYQKRQQIKHENLIDKMFFRASTLRLDPIQLREMNLCSEISGSQTIEEYLDSAIEYKIGLSISSVSEVTYREFEYMAVGIPHMRLRYGIELNPPLIPNHHYICVDREKYNLPFGPANDRTGGPDHVKAYSERFFEVKDDKEFLNFISNNAKQYYNEYCSPQNRLKHVLELLEIENFKTKWWER